MTPQELYSRFETKRISLRDILTSGMFISFNYKNRDKKISPSISQCIFDCCMFEMPIPHIIGSVDAKGKIDIYKGEDIVLFFDRFLRGADYSIDPISLNRTSHTLRSLFEKHFDKYETLMNQELTFILFKEKAFESPTVKLFFDNYLDFLKHQ